MKWDSFTFIVEIYKQLDEAKVSTQELSIHFLFTYH